MRLNRLELRHVGPFEEAILDLRGDDPQPQRVQFITGQNGGGKSILLDAVRFWFGGQYGLVERDLPRSGHEAGFSIGLSLSVDGAEAGAIVTSPAHAQTTLRYGGVEASGVWGRPSAVESLGETPWWIVDYWCPGAAQGSPVIRGFQTPEFRKVLTNALSGVYSRGQVTELLCTFDYLRDSRNAHEQEVGLALHATAERIIKESLLDGEYEGVRRATFTPMVRQAGHSVPLANVSSGNAYFIQRMITLLGRMYAVNTLSQQPVGELCNTPGLLLVDEVENHLHPRWQKRLIPAILAVFPNLQIVATTHSPFALTSWPEARVHVCRYDAARQVCTVTEETSAFAHKPVDEILLSGAFDETQPFGAEITGLLAARKQAMRAGDEPAMEVIERRLLELNPTYFSYLEIHKRLAALPGAPA